MTMPSMFRSVVEAQVRSGQERGLFENLPGAGKPIPGLMDADDPDWWIKGFIKREGVPAAAMLPPGLALKAEIERLPGTVAALRTEKEVRAEVEDLNHRIRRWIQIPVGPQVAVQPVDLDEVLEFWHRLRPPPPEPAPPAPGRTGWRRLLLGP
jgi:hypothetical protein